LSKGVGQLSGVNDLEESMALLGLLDKVEELERDILMAYHRRRGETECPLSDIMRDVAELKGLLKSEIDRDGLPEWVEREGGPEEQVVLGLSLKEAEALHTVLGSLSGRTIQHMLDLTEEDMHPYWVAVKSIWQALHNFYVHQVGKETNQNVSMDG
jgi:hypothetical protein